MRGHVSTIRISPDKDEVNIESEVHTTVNVKIVDNIVNVSRCIYSNEIVLALFEKYKNNLDYVSQETEEEIQYIKGL